jgi:hypothetical protein
VILSLGKQRLRLVRPQNAVGRRPCDELRVSPSVVVAIRAIRVVDGIGKVQREVLAEMKSSRGLGVSSGVVATKTHFTSCILREAMDMFPL